MMRTAGAAAALVAALTCLTACRWASSPASTNNGAGFTIQLAPSASEDPDAIEVTGVSDADLNPLREREPTDHAWTALLRVTVDAPSTAGGDQPLPMVGGYSVMRGGIRFQPRFPLDSGRPYHVVFDPSQLASSERAGPSHLQPVHAVVSAAASAPAAAPTRVVEVYPTTPQIPENQLRLYISFSAPMSFRPALDHLKLLDEAGDVVEAPFLPFDVGLWNADRTRFTLFFDPGRVKTGILPNEKMGRAIVPAQRYTLIVSADWPDANGNPLVSEYRRQFAVGPAQSGAIDPLTWKLNAPPAGGRDPLVVTFPQPLDHALLHRALLVADARHQTVAGEVVVDAGETRWRFTPADPWHAGDYVLAALPILEDGAGNQIGRAFEVPAGSGRAALDEPRQMSLRFRIP